MYKTKLGISVGLFGAALYFICFLGGFVPAVLLAGYALLLEENIWLRKTAVKSIALMVALELISAIVYFIPDIINLISELFGFFGGSFYSEFVSNLTYLLNSAIAILEKVLFLILGFKALHQGTIKIPVIDALIQKHMD